MIPEAVYSKYSQAMFDIAKEQHKMDEYGTELKAVRDTMQLNPELKKFIHHPLVPPQSKKETLHAIFADDVSPVVLQFLYVMIDRRRKRPSSRLSTGLSIWPVQLRISKSRRSAS